MKFNMKRLAVTAILLSSTSVMLADDNSNSRVGDIPGFGEDAYFAEGDYNDGPESAFAENNATYTEEQSVYDDEAAYQDDYAVSQVSDIVESPVQQAGTRQSEYAPVSLSELQPAAYHDGGAFVGSQCDGGCSPGCGCESACDIGCDGGCDGGCDSGCCIRESLNLPKLFDCNTWATYEALLWFPQSRKLPVLVASAAPGQLPILSPNGGPANGVTALFGGDVDGGLSAGFRGDYGKWVGKNVGIGGRFWWLGDNTVSYSDSGIDGLERSVGRPFFETNPAAPNGVGESSLLIGFTDVAANVDFTGDVSAESKLEMLAAELYGRFRLGSSSCHQLDFIGGYSHFRIDDSLSIQSITITEDAPPLEPAGPGSFRRFSDSFEAENRFNGGQIGFDLSASRGCWSVRSLTKVHLGNMDRKYTLNGDSSTSVNATPPVNFPGVGMLVNANNRGTTDLGDVFTFAPEANFKLAYRFRPNVSLSVGYSFIYFDRLALNGSAVDRANDGLLLGTGQTGAFPAAVMDMDDSLWVHGIDLGAVIDF